MIANSMLKKRLRVFANIASENDQEADNKISKKREPLGEKVTFSHLNFDSFVKSSQEVMSADQKEVII